MTSATVGASLGRTTASACQSPGCAVGCPERREPRNDRDLGIGRERPTLDHAVGVAQREFAGQRARRPPDHRDRRPTFRRASENEQLSVRAPSAATERPAPSVTLSLISGPRRRRLRPFARRRRRAPRAGRARLAATCSGGFSASKLSNARAPRRSGRARAPRDRRTTAPSARRGAPRALPRRGAPPRPSGSRGRSESATRHTRA